MTRSIGMLRRVRSALLGASALTALTLASPAGAIIINDGGTPQSDLDPANINGIGQMVVDQQNGFIGLCTATLINPRTVIFASHCVNENSDETAFRPPTDYGAKFGGVPIGFGFQNNNNIPGNSAIGHWLFGQNGGASYQTNVADGFYNANYVTYNPNSTSLGVGLNFLQSDVAMAALDTPAAGIPQWTLLFSPLSGPTHATITGYGTNGTAANPDQGIDFRRRSAENIISVLGSLDDQDLALFGPPKDGLPANLYMLDFNDPKFGTAQANQFDFDIFHDLATPNEGTIGPGDSGGPLIVDHAFSKPVIAAVLSGSDRFFEEQAPNSYGTTAFYQPLYLYWDWIVANNPYKYVSAKAGNGSWTDPAHWVIDLDPNYVTVDAHGNLVNGLPSTPAQGSADVPPGFGLVCFFEDCTDIATGNHDPNTPPPGPNPTSGNIGSSPAQVPDSEIDGAPANGTSSGGSHGSHLAADDTAPPAEGTATAGGEIVQGAPGASNFVPNDTDGDPTTGAPARYYDVTLSADGTTTLEAGHNIAIDRLTLDGAKAGLTIANGASLTTLIDTTAWAGFFRVDGTYTSVGDIALMGGVFSGNGVVNAPATTAVLGMIAPGTIGGVGTLTFNGNVILSSGSSLFIDKNAAAIDKLVVHGTLDLGGAFVFTPVDGYLPHWGDTGVFATADEIEGQFTSVVDTLPGVLKPEVTVIDAAAGDEAVVKLVAGSFLNELTNPSQDQIEIGTALDASRAAHYGDLKPLYSIVDLQTGAALAQSFENLAPDAERTMGLAGDMETLAYAGVLWQRTGTIGHAGNRPTETGFEMDGRSLELALSSASASGNAGQQFAAIGSTLADASGSARMPNTTGIPAAPQAASDTTMWLPNGMSGFLSGSSLDGSVAVGGDGGRADVSGFIIAAGLDMPVDDQLTVGASFAISNTTTDLRHRPSMVQTATTQGALYARYDFSDQWVAQAYAAYGGQAMQVRRVAVVGGMPFVAEGHTSGELPAFGITIGKEIDIDTGGGAPLALIPAVGVQTQSTEIDAFREHGSAAAMAFDSSGDHLSQFRLGFDADTVFDLGDIRARPAAHVFWVQPTTGDNNGTITAAFAGAPAAIMVFPNAKRGSGYAELGIGADFDLGEMMGEPATLTARYDATAGRNDLQYGAVTGKLSIHF